MLTYIFCCNIFLVLQILHVNRALRALQMFDLCEEIKWEENSHFYQRFSYSSTTVVN